MLEKLARIIGWSLIGYLYLRFWDMFAQTYTHQPGRFEGIEVLTKGSLAFNFWIGEIILGIIIPSFLLLNSRFRKNPNLRMIALALVVGGVVAYRWDTNLVGLLIVLTYLPQEIVARYTSYFPSLIEIIAGAGVVAYGLFAFTIGVRYFNVVDHETKHMPVESATETHRTLPEVVATD